MIDFRPATRNIEVSSDESVGILRVLSELSQNELVALTPIPQSIISTIENDRINLGVERGQELARELHCHLAVLVVPR